MIKGILSLGGASGVALAVDQATAHMSVSAMLGLWGLLILSGGLAFRKIMA